VVLLRPRPAAPPLLAAGTIPSLRSWPVPLPRPCFACLPRRTVGGAVTVRWPGLVGRPGLTGGTVAILRTWHRTPVLTGSTISALLAGRAIAALLASRAIAALLTASAITALLHTSATPPLAAALPLPAAAPLLAARAVLGLRLRPGRLPRLTARTVGPQRVRPATPGLRRIRARPRHRC